MGYGAAMLIAPVSATASSAYGDQAAERIINGNGLVDPAAMQSGDPVPTLWPSHYSSGDDAPGKWGFWHSAIGDLTPTIRFDLGDLVTIGGFHLWNANQPAPENDRGFRRVDVLVSMDDVVYSTLAADVLLANGPGSSNYQGESYTLPAASVRYVQMVVKENWGGTQVTGISEMRFFTPVPEPAGLLMWVVTAYAPLLRRRT